MNIHDIANAYSKVQGCRTRCTENLEPVDGSFGPAFVKARVALYPGNKRGELPYDKPVEFDRICKWGTERAVMDELAMEAVEWMFNSLKSNT